MNEHDTSMSSPMLANLDVPAANPSEVDSTGTDAPSTGEAVFDDTDAETDDHNALQEVTPFEEALPVVASEAEDPDPAPSFADAAPPSPSVEDLQKEIRHLQTLLLQASTDRVRKELASEEFRELFPDTRFEDLPDEVFESVQNGMPLSAAFALSERRRAQREARAAQVNKQNRTRSSGALGNAQTDLYSPDEVRARSRNEVRKNYDKILRSMQSWN